ncbi:sporulation histidine kinase inhibitor Sda [Oceanobacillus bengalensis]|uniref:Sporulation histidine kinase inhibitor Sda n=1 Tax=Oceanobacillus bengalensis TaxID=1435466 RepID=A0A494Z754_9BACI|nr:sporulation histidine kinase inhibitor Sda [Oceanobacillus bengalensis]
MEHLSDQLLIEAYLKAREYHLEGDFVALLITELDRRGISPSSDQFERNCNHLTLNHE